MKRQMSVLVLAVMLAGCAAALPWVTLAGNLLPVIVQAIGGIGSALGTISPQDDATIQRISTEAANDINLALGLAVQFKANNNMALVPQINADLAAAEAQLNALLPALHVTNPATIDKVKSVIQFLNSQIAAVEGLIPVVSGHTVTARRVITKPLTADEFKSRFNRMVQTPVGDPKTDTAFAKATVK